MGYLANHLATVTTGVFAAVLGILWVWFNGWTPLLDFIFIMAIPITVFLAAICWLAQKSADYVHDSDHHDTEKKSSQGTKPSLVYSSDGTQVTPTQLKEAKTKLVDELDTLRNTVKIKDTEIVRLQAEIASLETLVQIESLKAELANLKTLASK